MDMNFPIEGAIREPLMFMECILFFILLEVGLISIQKYFSITKEARNSTEVAYGILFLVNSISWLLRITSDYFIFDLFIRDALLKIGHLLQILGVLSFSFSIESQKKFIKPYFFTISISILLVFSSFIYLTTSMVINLIPVLAWSFFFYFLFIYLHYFNSKIKFKEHQKYKIIYIYIGFIFFIFGLIIGSKYITDIFGLSIRFFGALIQISSIGFIFLCINAQPPFTEFDWNDKIMSLFLVERSGLSIFTKHFKEDLKEVNPTILGGTVISAHLLLESTINEKGFSVIKRPDFTLIIFSGKKLTGILFSESDLNSLKYLLKIFISRIEEIYDNLLDDPIEDLTVFEPIQAICNEIFSL